MILKGKGWHIDDDGILFIGKDFKRGKGFLPWFNYRESVTGLIQTNPVRTRTVPMASATVRSEGQRAR